MSKRLNVSRDNPAVSTAAFKEALLRVETQFQGSDSGGGTMTLAASRTEHFKGVEKIPLNWCDKLGGGQGRGGEGFCPFLTDLRCSSPE